MKRFAALLLLAAMLTASLAACGSTSAPTADTTAPASSDAVTEPAETELTRANTPDTVPEGLDFKGATLHALIRDSSDNNTIFQQEFYAPEVTGDVLNDAVYARNLYATQRLNVRFEQTLTPGAWGNRNDFMGIVSSSAMAGDGSIDFVPWYAFCQPSLAAKQVYIDLLGKDVKYLDFDQPWWYQNVIRNATVNGKLYLCSGEYGLTSIAMMASIAFNIDLRDDYLPGTDFYAMVREGKWTFDAMLSNAKKVYKDVNGNGVGDLGDIFGFNGGRADQFIHGAQVPISVETNGVRKLALNNERMIKLVDTFQAYYSDPSYIGKSGAKFEEGSILFSNTYIRDVAKLREMEDDYGVLPIPKLDEAQDGYFTTLGDSYSILGIMASRRDLRIRRGHDGRILPQCHRDVL